ncbi:MAG TPA: hypothetical protein VMF65_02030, partial [Acidimicrobiales bacterium]|nr:hypothetical protein [Acidimicrobiales bacterium]
EMRRKGVTLMLLWLEYKEANPDGYAYTQFTRLYKAWKRSLDVVMRQDGNVKSDWPHRAHLIWPHLDESLSVSQSGSLGVRSMAVPPP